MNPEALAVLPAAARAGSRSNPYYKPGAYDQLHRRPRRSSTPDLLRRDTASRRSARRRPTFPEELRNRILLYVLNSGNTVAPPCKQQSPFTFGGETTQYPHVRRDPSRAPRLPLRPAPAAARLIDSVPVPGLRQADHLNETTGGTSMSVKVGINGFGRIGRNLFRAAWERQVDLEFVAVNDITDARTLAHLLKYDSTLGPVPGHGRGRRRLDHRSTASRSRCWPSATRRSCPGRTSASRSWSSRPGLFVDRENASKHLEAGADKVIISAPAKDPDVTVALGVNFDEAYDPAAHRIISNASCTTNCLAPVAKILNDGDRDRARPDDDDPRLHRRPAPPGHAAQGPAPRPRRRDQPDPDLDRRGEGDRARRAGAGGQAERDRGARARSPTGSVVDLVVRGGARDHRRGDQRAVRARSATTAATRGSSSTPRTRSSRPTSTSRPTRRSSTRS